MNRGSVCAEHFVNEDFRRKNKTELKPKSIPSVFNVAQNAENKELERLNFEVTQVFCSTSSDSDLATNSVAIEHSPVSDNNDDTKYCANCNSNEVIIDKLEHKINVLENQLKTIRNKAHYLQSVNDKLSDILSATRKQQLIDDKMCKSLEVNWDICLSM